MTDRDVRIEAALARLVAALDERDRTYLVGENSHETIVECHAALDHARKVLAGEVEPEAELAWSGTPLAPESHDGPSCPSTFGTKGCARPNGHAGQHLSPSGSTWP